MKKKKIKTANDGSTSHIIRTIAQFYRSNGGIDIINRVAAIDYLSKELFQHYWFALKRRYTYISK